MEEEREARPRQKKFSVLENNVDTLEVAAFEMGWSPLDLLKVS